MKILAAIFTFFILTVIVLADMDRLGFLGNFYDYTYGDKVGHFTLFGILTFLVVLTLLRSRPFSNPKRVAVIVTLTLVLAIGLEEWSQKFFPGRASDWMDLLFSYAGVALGAWVGYKKH